MKHHTFRSLLFGDMSWTEILEFYLVLFLIHLNESIVCRGFGKYSHRVCACHYVSDTLQTEGLHIPLEAGSEWEMGSHSG